MSITYYKTDKSDLVKIDPPQHAEELFESIRTWKPIYIYIDCSTSMAAPSDDCSTSIPVPSDDCLTSMPVQHEWSSETVEHQFTDPL